MKSLVKLGAVALGVIGAAILAMFLLFGGGEKAKIEATLRQSVEDARAGDAAKCIGYISGEYEYEGVNYEQVCALVRQYIGPGKWRKIELRGLDVEVMGETAKARLLFWLEGDVMREVRQGFPLKLDLFLKREVGDWRIIGHRVVER